MLSFLTGLVLVLAAIWFACQILGYIAAAILLRNISKGDSNE